jgi:hypothetical protein
VSEDQRFVALVVIARPAHVPACGRRGVEGGPGFLELVLARHGPQPTLPGGLRLAHIGTLRRQVPYAADGSVPLRTMYRGRAGYWPNGGERGFDLKKRLMAGLAMAGLMAAMLPGVALGVGSPGDACPKQFAKAEASAWAEGPKTDVNGDGIVCVRSLPEQAAGDYGIIIDNAARK